MQLDRLIRELSDPSAFPFPVEAVEVRQTHCSVIFLTPDFVYKLRKPVDFGFLDYSTRELRLHFSHEEIRQNAPLAPDVYVGVVAVTQDGDRATFEGRGEPIDHAVKMRRLPDEAHLRARLAAGEDIKRTLDDLIERMLAYYERPDGITAISRTRTAEAAKEQLAVIARNASENFTQASSHVGLTVTRAVLDRVRDRSTAALEEIAPLMKLRASAFTRITHGDLRLDHVYSLPDMPANQQLTIIDCVEFNERLRIADIVADLAFLAMDLIAAGRRDLANHLISTYERLSGDTTGRALFPFYVAYRSAVRAKVQGMSLGDRDQTREEHAEALRKARVHWLVALDQLEPASRRPGLVLIGGLPGTGKSTLAFRLAALAGFDVVRSDAVRKELAGEQGETGPIGFGEGIYTPQWDERTYQECFRRAEGLLLEGKRVILDANFGRQASRASALGVAHRLAVRSLFLVCESDATLIRQRLENRTRDASDADWSTHLQAALRWEPIGPDAVIVRPDEAPDRTVLEHLAEAGLI